MLIGHLSIIFLFPTKIFNNKHSPFPIKISPSYCRGGEKSFRYYSFLVTTEPFSVHWPWLLTV